MLGRLDVDELMRRVDIGDVLNRVDLNELMARVDVTELIGRVDMEAILDRVDINEIVSKVDIDGIVERTEIGSLDRAVDERHGHRGARRGPQRCRRRRRDHHARGRPRVAAQGSQAAPARTGPARARPVCMSTSAPPVASLQGNYAGVVSRTAAYVIDAALIVGLYTVTVSGGALPRRRRVREDAAE